MGHVEILWGNCHMALPKIISAFVYLYNKICLQKLTYMYIITKPYSPPSIFGFNCNSVFTIKFLTQASRAFDRIFFIKLLRPTQHVSNFHCYFSHEGIFYFVFFGVSVSLTLFTIFFIYF